MISALSSFFLVIALFCVQFSVALSTILKLPPHAGYHGAGADPRKPFFEGWYLRLTTQKQESVALIFHVFDPHKPSKRRGVGMQIVSPTGSLFVESSDLSTFRADSHELELRNYFPSSKDYFRVTANRVSGRASSSENEGLIIAARFDFDIFPLIGWGGGADSRQCKSCSRKHFVNDMGKSLTYAPHICRFYGWVACRVPCL